ncbi:MAG: hypothetical protein KAY32_10370, partial [Candidatus Eisenbacteria sp.]|nr:hypothetical protein [Candidatus Eisenbacteria bacterium]
GGRAVAEAAGRVAALSTSLPGAGGLPGRRASLDGVVDRLREQFGFRALVRGPSLELLAELPSDVHGFILRTPSLTR